MPAPDFVARGPVDPSIGSPASDFQARGPVDPKNTWTRGPVDPNRIESKILLRASRGYNRIESNRIYRIA